ATTRNEFDARFQAHEDYEPAVPDVTVNLESTSGVLLNQYITDHWQHPNASQDPPQTCAVRDSTGADIGDQMNPALAANCIESPITGEQTKDGAFDGGYAFADYCPVATGGYNVDSGACQDGTDPVALVAGDYVVHVVMPKDTTDSRPCNPSN